MGRRVLVIEDDPANARLLATLMRTEGAEVKVAPDAQQGLKVLLEFQAQLVILDLVLPRMSGLMFARLMKADPATRSAVVIAVSGINGPQTERLALESGCAAYVAKPIDIEAFLDVVRAHIGGARDLQ